MLNLVLTTDKLALVTDAAVTVDVHASFADLSGTTVTPGKQNTAITTAATTDIVASPAASTVRNVKTLHIRNKHATSSVAVTVQYNQNATLFELHKITLLAGEMLEYVEGIGFFVTAASSLTALLNSNTSDQSVAAATTAYITGTAMTFPTSRPFKVGTYMDYLFSITKTAAGTASSTFDVRFGTAGTTADTTRLAFATGTATAVVDTGFVRITCVVRGPIGASCIVEGNMFLTHNLQLTGFSVLPNIVVNTTSAPFDITTANIIAGVSVTTGASSVWNFELVNTRIGGA